MDRGRDRHGRGAGEWLIAAVGTFIVVFSLWPLNALVARLHKPGTHAIKLRLEVGRLEALGDVSRLLADRRVEMAGINSQRIGKGRYEVELELRLPTAARPQDIIGAITAIPDVELMESATPATERQSRAARPVLLARPCGGPRRCGRMTGDRAALPRPPVQQPAAPARRLAPVARPRARSTGASSPSSSAARSSSS